MDASWIILVGPVGQYYWRLIGEIHKYFKLQLVFRLTNIRLRLKSFAMVVASRTRRKIRVPFEVRYAFVVLFNEIRKVFDGVWAECIAKFPWMIWTLGAFFQLAYLKDRRFDGWDGTQVTGIVFSYILLRRDWGYIIPDSSGDRLEVFWSDLGVLFMYASEDEQLWPRSVSVASSKR